MADPLGFISGQSNPLHGLHRGGAKPPQRDGGAGAGAGPSFKDALLKSIQEANDLQQQATRAVEDLQTGQRTDVEGVILATQKADNAFRMLQQVRNRMMEAYDEVKQIRV
jgi:flagellar hook-basal body complex protein FliE